MVSMMHNCKIKWEYGWKYGKRGQTLAFLFFLLLTIENETKKEIDDKKR